MPGLQLFGPAAATPRNSETRSGSCRYTFPGCEQWSMSNQEDGAGRKPSSSPSFYFQFIGSADRRSVRRKSRFAERLLQLDEEMLEVVAVFWFETAEEMGNRADAGGLVLLKGGQAGGSEGDVDLAFVLGVDTADD